MRGHLYRGAKFTTNRAQLQAVTWHATAVRARVGTAGGIAGPHLHRLAECAAAGIHENPDEPEPDPCCAGAADPARRGRGL